MSIVSQPNVTVNILAANNDVSNTPQKVLFVGQGLGDGSYTDGALVENIGNDTSVINGLFGQASMMSEMLRQAREINDQVQFDAICLDDDGSAVQREYTTTFVGTATADGTLTFVLGSSRLYTYEVPITSGQTAAQIATACQVVFAAENITAPFTSAASTTTVVFTARNGGVVGNGLTLAMSGEVPGITYSVAATAVGANDPTLTNVFDVIGDNRYQTIIWPYGTTDATVSTFLDNRFNTDNQVLDGVAITIVIETYANLVTAGDDNNSKSLLFIGDKFISATDKIGGSIEECPYAICAQIGAIRALRLTDGASIANYVISNNGALDSFGGPALASKPYFNTPMALLPVIEPDENFTTAEIEGLQDAGISILGNNITRTSIIMGEMVTNYKTDVAGNPDVSFKYLNYVDTASNCREYFFNNLRATFAQSRLTEGDLIRGRDMANAERIAAVCTGLYSDLAGADYVLLQAGEDALQFFKNNLSVTLDLDEGKATVQMTVPLVTQLRQILATMKIAFSANG